MNIIVFNVFFSIVLLKYAYVLKNLEYEEIQKRLSICIINFVLAIIVGFYLVYTSVEHTDVALVFSLFSYFSYLVFFYSFFNQSRKAFIELSREAFEKNLLKSPKEVKTYLANNDIHLYGTPIFLVLIEKNLYWHIGKDLKFPDLLISIYGESCDPCLKYAFVLKKEKIVIHKFFWGKYETLFQNTEYELLLEEMGNNKDYDFLKKEEC